MKKPIPFLFSLILACALVVAPMSAMAADSSCSYSTYANSKIEESCSSCGEQSCPFANQTDSNTCSFFGSSCTTPNCGQDSASCDYAYGYSKNNACTIGDACNNQDTEDDNINDNESSFTSNRWSTQSLMSQLMQILGWLNNDYNSCDDQFIWRDDNFATEETDQEISEYALLVVEYVNAARAAEGLEPLEIDPLLSQAAEIRCNEICQVFSHTRPDNTSCFTALEDVGAVYSKAGENIAIGQQTPEEVVEAWLASPGHRENIMNPDFTRIGVGAIPSCAEEYGGYSWVQFFAD